MNSKHIREIEKLFDEVSVLAGTPEEKLQRVREDVSAWSVGQQLDHMIKVASSLLRGILEPSGTGTLPGINVAGRLILLVGRIPRGRGKSPQRLRGVASSSRELMDGLDEARSLLKQVADQSFHPADVPVVRHPFFGGLTPEQTLRTAVVHTRHHLRIVRDINESA